ncbi:MAG: Holliday junction resolvase RuvX [Clostridiales bacterium]|jgi:putative Holliday junction resolvase|nr:Holliday junction resolvase RuvX [Clostridiales bacterium]
MRVLGLDYGDRTIGVAISDPFGWTAQGLEVIRRKEEKNLKDSIARIKEIAESYNAEKIILGYPKNMNNTEGIRCEKTQLFKERLAETLSGIDIALWDERLSTMAASRSLLEADVSRQKRKKVIDKMAAVFILQGYLDAQTQKTVSRKFEQ